MIVLYTATRQPTRITPEGNRFWVGPAHSVQWFSRGDIASREEALAALDVAHLAMKERAAGNESQLDKLARLYHKALAVLPSAA